MVQLTNQQRVWICLEYARVNNAHEVRRRWPAHFPGRIPSITTILKNVRKLNQNATCHNLNKGQSGRPKTALTPQNIDNVRRSLVQDGNRSSRRNGLGLTQSSFVRITHQIKFHPYVLVRRQGLRDGDPAQRLNFCNRLIQMNQNDRNFLQNLISSDEAIFSLNSEVNTRNVRKYCQFGNGHPDDHYVSFEQGADQLMVWIGLTGSGSILGPHFIQGNLNTQEYLRIVRYNVVQRDFRRLNINRLQMWWQQDGASAHTSNASLRYLRGQFPGKVISKRGDWPWPPRSPDLTVCDFFLWGFLKQKIWSRPIDDQPKNLRQLREAIILECQNLQPEMIEKAFRGMIVRARKCINVNGNCFRDE